MLTSIVTLQENLSGVRIGYDNAALDATLGVTSAESGKPIGNIATWIGGKRWKATSSADQTITLTFASARSANAFGLYGHNLGTIGATVALQYSTDGGGTWTTLVSLSPTDNETIFRIFDSVSDLDYRVQITGASAAAEIGNLYVGDAVAFPALDIGFAPPQLARDNEIMNNTSEGGETLGKSLIRQASRLRLEWSLQSEAWARQTYLPWQKAAEAHAWYLAWDHNRYPAEVGFCDFDGNPRPAGYSHGKYHRVRVEAVAR